MLQPLPFRLCTIPPNPLLLALERYPKVFVRISHMWSLPKQPYPYPDAQDQVKRLRDKFGAERLMWGTDWPISLKNLRYPQAVELFRKDLDFLNRLNRGARCAANPGLVL